MAIKGTITDPPEDMTEESVRAKAEGLLAALKAMKAKAPEQNVPEPDQAVDPPEGTDELPDEESGRDDSDEDEAKEG